MMEICLDPIPQDSFVKIKVNLDSVNLGACLSSEVHDTFDIRTFSIPSGPSG
ncbi:hypothetical protein WG66_016919, partial [Moniliophthora roreri]